MTSRQAVVSPCLMALLCAIGAFAFSDPLWAQSSPFQTGANSLVTNVIAIATPIAILLVMVLGIVAATGRISWGWPIGVILGIGIMFGAPTIVTWVRGLFGV